MDDCIYKICTVREWSAAVADGVYAGSAADAADGFIHFSTGDQVAGTLDRHFAGQDGLVLLSVPVARLEDAGLAEALKWEESRGGALFPHLYAPLPVAAVAEVSGIPRHAGGHRHIPVRAD